MILFARTPLTTFLSFKNPTTTKAMSSSSVVVAEYAKSNRSTCKTCSNTIDSKALRLGVVTKNPQKRYDMTKWHHFQCLPFDSLFIDSPDSIKGFNSLKSDDQEELKKKVETCEKVEKVDEEAAEDKPSSTKKEKVKKVDEEVAAEDKPSDTKKEKARKRENKGDEKKEPKKLQLSVSDDATAEIALSITDIKENYKEATLLPKWKAFHTIIFLEKDDGFQDSSKIAAFDFDGCLANTNVKRVGADAWSLMYPSIPDKLRKLHDEGYKLVIFTNESNIERWTKKRQVAVDSKIGRLNSFIKLVNLPIQVFIACGFDKSGRIDPYRKPQPGMWRVMEQHFNSGIPVDMDCSFYVGDAAGRPNDHSSADIKFAEAVGLKFHVPEEFFDV